MAALRRVTNCLSLLRSSARVLLSSRNPAVHKPWKWTNILYTSVASLTVGGGLCAIPFKQVENLSHDSLIRRAASLVTDSSSTFLSQTTLALIDAITEYSKAVHTLIALQRRYLESLGKLTQAEENTIWQVIISQRAEVSDRQDECKRFESTWVNAVKLCERAAEAAYTSGVSSNQVVVPEKVNAVLGKNITLGCRIEVGSNLSLTQSSWERRLPSGTITLAVFHPEFGTSISKEYAKRISFVSPSVRDATITIEGAGFADIGSYICKVATFPLGNTQASTFVNVLVEPKVYVSAGPTALLDGGNESLVATCIAERGRPAAEVFWETELYGRSEKQSQDEPNGTSTTHVHYMWQPQSYAQGKTLTCVVRHPALQTEFRIPFILNVQFAPMVSIVGIGKNWHVGQEKVKFTCDAKANPPARHFTWIRLDGLMPEGVEISNNSFAFARPLERNDSGVYRCEVMNDIGLRSQDVILWVQDPPPTTAAPSTTASLLSDISGTGTAADQRRALFTSPTLASLSDSSLGTIVGGAVGGVLFLILLLILGGACFMRQRRTFRGDYYTKQYLGPSDMQKESQLDVLQPHELQEVYGDKTSKGSQELKPKLGGDIIYPDYTPERKDRDDWADRGDSQRGLKEGNYYPDHYNTQNMHPCGPPVHSPIVNNGSPYLPEDCYDNGTDSDYVSHMDGSVISRREWYV